MKSFILLLLIVAVVYTDTCTASQNYVLVIKQSRWYSEEESFAILDGSEVLEESYYLTSDELEEFEYCLRQTTNDLYTLQLTDSRGDSWTEGSWIEIRGAYGNTFFKGTMVDNNKESYTLSLHYAIKKNIVWMLNSSSSLPSTWKDADFGDSDWSTTTTGVTIPFVAGTQYFRKTFTGITGMAAYETSIFYKNGIIAYINGQEVFRDNLPDGPVDYNTQAQGVYPTATWHNFIRPGFEIADTTSILAVEVHFNEMFPSLIFNAYIATLAPSVIGHACYMVNNDDVTITSSITSKNDLFDLDIGTSASKASVSISDPAVFTFNYQKYAFINGLRIWPSSKSDRAPRAFTWKSKVSDTEYHSIITENDMSYTNNKDAFTFDYFNGGLYQTYELTVTSTRANRLDLYEIHPLVCSGGAPTAITFAKANYTYNAIYDTVSIVPVAEFTGCTITPQPPTGLTFNNVTCSLVGVSEVGLPLTTFNVSTVLDNVTYSGSFQLEIIACSGVMTLIRRKYNSYASSETFTIKNSAQEVVLQVLESTTQESYEEVLTYLCLPIGQYTVTVGGSNDYWSTDSYLYVEAMISDNNKETILRSRFDSKLALPTILPFSLNYVVPSHSSWHYKMGSVPTSWYNDEMSGWDEGDYGMYPESSNKIQLYKTQFNVATVENYAGFALNLRYKFGCIIYMNGHEVFRNGVDGDLSTSSATENIYDSLKYHTITLPTKTFVVDNVPSIQYIKQGTNTIAIAIVTTSTTRTSMFDCSVRLMAISSESRVLDGFSVLSSGISYNADKVFNDVYTNSIFVYSCAANYITIKFNDDRREWINQVGVQLYYDQDSQFPTQFIFKARNSDDDEWVTLKVFFKLQWSMKGQLKQLWIQNNQAYNQYRFDSFGSGNPDACSWKLSRLDVRSAAMTDVVPDLKYVEPGQTLSIYRGIEMAEAYPNSDLYYDFSITPELPEGITMDSNTGMISGTTNVNAMTASYTINAKKYTGETATCTLPFAVTYCTGAHSLITLVVRTDSYPSEGSYKLFEGKGTSGSLVSSVDQFTVGNALNYYDFCLDNNIYTAELKDRLSDGWTNPAGYYLTVDVGELLFEMGQLPSSTLTVTTMFSSYLPFQIEYTDWMYLLGGNVDADWKKTDYTPSESWKTGKAADIGTNTAVTTYIRKEFTIPSLEDYQVMNMRIKYNGGVVVYFNNRKVARFNLAEDYNDATESIEVLPQPIFSTFHIILSMSGATTDKNVIAIEIHRPLGQSSSEPVVFDATAVFGVNDCSIVLDSYSHINGTEPSSGTLEDFFDMKPTSYGYLPNEVGSYMEWTVANLEGSRFNSYAWQTASYVSSWSFSLYGRKDSENEYTSILAELDQTHSERQRHSWPVDAGLASFRTFKYEMDQTASKTVSFSAHFFVYCKATGGVCPGIGDYPPVSKGQISPSSCPEGFKGYSYRECNGEILSDIRSDKCVYKNPVNLHYNKETYNFVRDTFVTTGVAHVENIVTEYFMGKTSVLPEGLKLDPITGEISGIPTTVTEPRVYTIHGKNPRSGIFTELTISVRKGICNPEGLFERTEVNQVAVYDCALQGSYVGSMKRACILGEKDGEWQETTGVCISVVTIVIIILVVILVIAVLIIVIIKVTRKGKAVGGVKNGKKVQTPTDSKDKPKKVNV